MYIKTFLYRSRSYSTVSRRVCSLTFFSIGEKHLGLGNNENFVLQISSKTSLRESGHVLSFALKMLWFFLAATELTCSGSVKISAKYAIVSAIHEILVGKEGDVIVLFYTDKFKNAAVLNSSCK